MDLERSCPVCTATMGGAKKPTSPRETRNNEDDNANDTEARERDLVEAYVQEHALEETLNALVNQIVADRPADPLLVLSSLLYGRATSKRGIFHVECHEILDAMGLPGVLVRVHTGKGVFEVSCSSVVDGLPDRIESQDEFTPTIPHEKQRFYGRGYRQRAEQAQQVLIQTLVDVTPTDQAAADAALQLVERDIGRNVCLAASMAICKAGARYAERPLYEHIASLLELPLENVCLPMPLFSVLNAGILGSTRLFVQELFVVPVSATSLADAIQIGAELTHEIQRALDERGVGLANRGAFGGFASPLASMEETFEILHSAVDALRNRLESTDPASLLLDSNSITPLRLEFGLDVAATEFVTPAPVMGAFPGEDEGDVPPQEEMRTVFTYDTDKWIRGSSGNLQSSQELLELIQRYVRELDLSTIIDPFDRGDVKAFASLMSSANDVPSDDRNVENPRRVLGGDLNCRLQVVARADPETLDRLRDERATNTALIQLDQFATVSRVLQSITDARCAGLAVMLGATIGNGNDADVLSAIAIGAGIGQVKFGGLLAHECVARYNQLLLTAEGPVPPTFTGNTYRR